MLSAATRNTPRAQLSRVVTISTAQAGEMQPTLPPLKVIVLRAHIPSSLETDLQTGSRLHHTVKFYVAVTYGSKTWKSKSKRSRENVVEWNERVDAFEVQQLSRITVSVHAKSTMRKDILIGRQEIASEHQHELDIDLSGVKLFLTITLLDNDDFSLTTTDLDNLFAASAARHTVQSISETISPISPTADVASPLLVSRSRDYSTDSVRREADSQPEKPHITLRRAELAIDTMRTWASAVDIIKRVMDTVSPIPELGPYADLTWSLLAKIPETLLRQVQRDDNVQALLETIRDAFGFAKEADILRNIKPGSRQATILKEMLGCVFNIVEFIELYAKNVQVGNQTLKNIRGQDVEQYRINLVRLRDDFLARAAVTTEVAVLEAELGAMIRELPYRGGWRFGNEKRCLPGTRKEFLDYIVNWVENPRSERGLVLFGQAGTGKSSIAHEVAHLFDKTCLGSYFAFLRKEQSKDDAYQLFTTLARDLSDRNPAFKHALGRVVKDKSSLRSAREYRTLFDCLLLEPLKKLPLLGPIVIIIDALDESGDTVGKSGLHTFLAQNLIDLPPNFRIFITSRPEDRIEFAFANAMSVHTIYMNDPNLAAKTEQDIRLYLQNELPPEVFEDHGIELAKAAEGVFQWAAVASSFINSPSNLGLSMKTRVRRLLGHSRGLNGEGLLDNLYEEVLKEFFKSVQAQALFRSIIGHVLAAIEPLSINSLMTLRRHAPIDNPEDSDPVLVFEILRHLGSLLSNVTSSDATQPIVPLHSSFRDFLISKTSDVFYVDLDDAHHQLAHSCLTIMLNNLKFNICKLESSHLANSDVPDLKSRIAKYVPPALSYACIYWDDHLAHVLFERELFQKLRSLFESKFLFWLEVLSIKNSVGLASPALSSLSMWLQREHSQTEVKNLLTLVNDASAFVRYFGMAVARSAPHIYISALPFAPSSSLILNQYACQFPRTLTLKCGQLSHWPALEMTIQAHSGFVFSVAFSPDGERIASASSNHTIHVWDATTGQVVVGPFTGHTDWVTSVTFSPDGELIASASSDLTIRVWDATTGQVVAGPFTGHTDWVRSVAFSPDGERIASASSDNTVRVWDATTGEVVAGPFTGHTDWVNSVAFSPDGERIASASSDETIRVWDSTTGHVVAGPFAGHTDWVKVVAFSPDGERITSASDDHTILVWDATTGQVVAGPFTGHTDWVTSIAFSPDGEHIASASSDHTIRVWDAITGQVVAGPFTGHTNSVTSVAFSPDGERIASASSDDTIRVWDATTGQVVADSFAGHTDWVRSVAFSPDGQRIASASSDETIRVWDATTGHAVAGPFSGHTNWVTSVAFSPDGERITSASDDYTIRVWDATTGEVMAGPFAGHTHSVTSVAFSPDGERIASASSDETIRVWDATRGHVVAGPFTGHTDWVTSIAFSPDGERIASASSDHTIRVWGATTGQVVAGPFTEHTDWVRSIAFSPDGGRIASASSDRTIRVWDATTGLVVAGPFTGHTDWVTSVAFSPDGKRIASASSDRTIRVWDATTGQVVGSPFAGHTDWVTSVAFSPDGEHIASASDDHTIRVWDATIGQAVAGPSTEHTSLVRSEKIYFTDESVITSDGWICGEDGELFLWIPELHRLCLHRPSTVWISGEHETRLDLSKFVHGSDWAIVHDHN